MKTMRQLRQALFPVLISFIAGVFIAAALQRMLNLFLYSLAISSVISFGLAYMIFPRFNGKKRFNSDHRIMMSMIASLLAFSFLATVPLTIDRSFSVWLLKNIYTLEKNQLRVTPELLERDSVAYFSPENGELRRRFLEQAEVGNLQRNRNNEISLTSRGKLIVQINSFIGIFFGLDPKYSRLDP